MRVWGELGPNPRNSSTVSVVLVTFVDVVIVASTYLEREREKDRGEEKRRKKKKISVRKKNNRKIEKHVKRTAKFKKHFEQVHSLSLVIRLDVHYFTYYALLLADFVHLKNQEALPLCRILEMEGALVKRGLEYS